MKFPVPLIKGVLVQRYKRFLADIRLESGDVITVHCPNPGAMIGLNEPGNLVWISDSQNDKRKLRYTLELMQVNGPEGPTLVGINTMHPNKIAEEAIKGGRIPELAEYETIRREVKYGENSRIDLLLEADGKDPCYVEVKNVHWVRSSGLHEFPDYKTSRGTKHLNELSNLISQNKRAVMLYVIQREDGDRFSIADDFDPNYAQAFDKAREAGVEAIAIRCQISTDEIVACDLIPIV